MSGLSRHWIAAALLTVAVVAAVVAGIVVIGSPADERLRQLDERRVQDLGRIARASDLYWTRHERLAASLDEIKNEPGADVVVADPGTQSSYRSRAVDATTYEVCAQFETDSAQSIGRGNAGFWSHGIGRQCFRREAHKVG